MARVPNTFTAYESYVMPPSSKGYLQRFILGTWFRRPEGEELLKVLPAGAQLDKVKTAEISVTFREGKWYKVSRRPVLISGVPSEFVHEPVVVENRLIWPVSNEDGTNTGMFYVRAEEVYTVRVFLALGLTCKPCTVNDKFNGQYQFTCSEKHYEHICKTLDLS